MFAAVIDEQFGQALGQPEGGLHHIQDDGEGGRSGGAFCDFACHAATMVVVMFGLGYNLRRSASLPPTHIEP